MRNLGRLWRFLSTTFVCLLSIKIFDKYLVQCEGGFCVISVTSPCVMAGGILCVLLCITRVVALRGYRRGVFLVEV